MRFRKNLSILGLMLALAIALPVLRADERNQATRFTFSGPVQIPGQVLPAGTYFFQLLGTADRDVVQILGEDRETVVATVFTAPRERHGQNANDAITMADRGPAEPAAIVAWFFAGQSQGHEFLYSQPQAQELAHATQKTIASGD